MTPPLVKWSRDGKLVYLHSAPTRQTFVIPLTAGQLMAPLGALALAEMADAAKLPGARLRQQQRVFPSADPTVYAFARVTTHRNIYRVSVQ